MDTHGRDRETPASMVVLRRLWPADHAAYRAHLLRLDDKDLAARFGPEAGALRIKRHVAGIDWFNDTVIGLFIDGTLRGSGLVSPIGWPMPRTASAALCIEEGWQGQRHGQRLLKRLLVSAQNRMIAKVLMVYASENVRMQRLAEQFGGQIGVFEGSREGEFDLEPPSPLSWFSEAAEDGMALAFSWPAAPWLSMGPQGAPRPQTSTT